MIRAFIEWLRESGPFDGWRQFGTALSWSDLALSAADIAIVYYLIYRSLLLIRGTRAAQMLTGIVFVGGGLFLAKHLQLGTVSWLFDYLLGHFIIVLIVVFQHDIRRALMRLGRSLWPARRRVEEGTLIEEVLGAIEALSVAKEGALIVLERDMDLGEMLEPGIEVDAAVSSQLLIALFLKGVHNPLHDGAVLIKNLRVAQAAVVLPLSSNPRLDRSLGTRHRAGIGITEETDAVAIVVSEDRGRVSLCFQGNLINELTVVELRSTLLTLFGQGRDHDSVARGRPFARQPVARGQEPTASISEAPAGAAELPLVEPTPASGELVG